MLRYMLTACIGAQYLRDAMLISYYTRLVPEFREIALSRNWESHFVDRFPMLRRLRAPQSRGCI